MMDDPMPREDVKLPPPVGYIRREDAEAAVALVVEQAVKEGMRIAASIPIHQVQQAMDAAIRALAPDAGIKALAELREERDALETARERLGGFWGKAIAERDRIAADNAALARAEDAEKQHNALWQANLRLIAERDALRARLAEMEGKVGALVEAVIWCSGSNDFQDGGVAREGWLKLCAPLIQPATPAAAEEDPPCTDCDDTGITRQTERYCTCDAGRTALAAAGGDAMDGEVG